MKKRVLVTSLMVLLSVVLFSCGGGGVGGGAEVFKTVTLTAQSLVNLLDSDVAKHSDVANCGGGTDAVSVAPDSVDVEIASTLNPGQPSSITGSDVRLEYVKVKYKPATDTTKPLPEQKYVLSSIVPVNGSVTLSVLIASQQMKLVEPLTELQCSSNIFKYFVTLEFKGTEIDTGKSATFETNLTVNFADFIDS